MTPAQAVYGPKEADFGNERAAHTTYLDAVRTEGPDSPAAESAHAAWQATADAAEQMYCLRDMQAEEAEAG